MERPERPSRHKSNPVSKPKLLVRPTYSSDSESDQNEENPVQISFYHSQQQTETDPYGEGPSTSSAVPQTPSQQPTETPSTATKGPMCVSPVPLASMKYVPPRPRAGFLPSSPTPPEEDPHAEPSLLPMSMAVRRKRLAATSAAASVIFDSVDSLINTSQQMLHSRDNPEEENNEQPEPERPADRFQHTDFLIRPRSFCNIDSSFPYKPKRLSAPIDLTSSLAATSSRTLDEPTSSGINSTFSNVLRDCTMDQPPYLSRSANVPTFIPPRREQPSSSSILRQFDEMCSSNQIRRRQRNNFLRESRMNRNQGEFHPLQDYCDLVGHLFSTYNNQEHSQRGHSPVNLPSASESQPTATADMIRQAVETPDIVNNFIELHEDGRNELVTPTVGAEITVESNDDVIVVETPERPPLPTSPDMVPSSRSPSPRSTFPTSPSPGNPPKRPRLHCGDVPLTLQELNQTLVALLECPVCLDHATPPIYQCVKGHILCQNCHPRLSSCPICRSRLPGDRNSSMEKVAEKLMYPCKNTVTGCTMMLKLDDKQEHEDGCGFRHYACIRASCQWKGYKPELVVHLQSNHPDTLITGNTKEVQVPLTGSLGVISHHWIQSAHNEVFDVIFHVDLCKRIMKGCVIYIGAPEKAGKFIYLFELKQRTAPFRKLTYSRTTHADTVRPQQPLCLSNDFSINIDMARLYRPDDCHTHTIPITVSILPVVE